ncbi:helix-turn-helix domain-containing protein [Streptomyces sp. SID12501]|uniref:Helix-turn-helix domain-containing protein n=1 Tax=Streptomyces sp. SID12501 TaxID=2706042 RepID=A0A6B3C705_9ACTN|nr:helix-turn-helix domain-containing protein [Streptomyces sp. SID12501]NEC92206.1 helix-turn-helix domain-containing protein [Streptomyces sp. SID12501]
MSRSLAPEFTAQNADEWLTPRETAALTKFSVQTLANHRSLGVGIPYTKLTPGRAGRIRYLRGDVERFLRGQNAGGA